MFPNGKVLCAGGATTTTFPLTTTDIYDPATGSWTPTTPLNVARAALEPVVLPNGKVLVVAGDASGTTCEIYDPATATWTLTGSLLHPRAAFHTALLSNGKVLVAGGLAGPGVVPQAEVYNPATGPGVTPES